MNPSAIVAITGASSGIGASLAIEAAKRGGRVGLMARRVEELETVAQAVRDAGGEAMIVPTDVGERSSVEGAFQAIEREWGLPDMVVANAGGLPTSVGKWFGSK